MNKVNSQQLLWIFANKNNFLFLSFLLLSFQRASTPGETQAGLRPRVYFLLPQTAVLPRSDAGSDGVKPALSFVIQNRQTLCSVWCPMYRAERGLQVCSVVQDSQFNEGARPHLYMDKWIRPTPARR